MSSITNNPVEISSFYPHLSMMPSLMNTAPKLPPNIYRPNSWMDLSMQPYFYYNIAYVYKKKLKSKKFFNLSY